MVGHQQLVLFAQPVGVPVGGLGVDLAPLRVLLADRLARGRAVAPLLALGGDVVGGVPGLLVGLLGGCEFERQRVDLGGDVALVQVLGLLDCAPVVLDGQPVGVLVQPGIGDRAAEPVEHVGGVDADVVAGVGDDVDGLGGARMRRVDGEQLARQRVRLGLDGLGAEELRPDVVQLQAAAHVGLVDEPQHLVPVLVGHQESQARAAQHLLHGCAPAGLVGLEVQKFGDVGEFGGVGADGGADVVAHREGELGQRRADVLDALEFLGGVVAGDAGGLLRVLGVGGRLPVAFDLGEQLGGLGEQFLAEVPELVGGVRDLDVLGGEQVLVGGAAAGRPARPRSRRRSPGTAAGRCSRWSR